MRETIQCMGSAAAPPDLRTCSSADLSRVVVGRPMSHQALWDLLETAEDPHGPEVTITVGSIGYERFKTNEAFAKALADRGFIRLIDVRELPISRKRGFAI